MNELPGRDVQGSIEEVEDGSILTESGGEGEDSSVRHPPLQVLLGAPDLQGRGCFGVHVGTLG